MDLVSISQTELIPERIINGVGGDDAGAINVFIGTVRNSTEGRDVQYLEFEAYEPMALKEMQKIVDETKEKWPVVEMAIHHRVGKLEIGAIPVVIAVATAHRKQGFEACEYAIDTLKKTVPIWKKEIFTDGEQWVSAHP
jgi:molybdopterin synthase catalytic subunit